MRKLCVLFRRCHQFFHTIRHLKPIQVYGRIWFFLTRSRAAKVNIPFPKLREVRGLLVAPARRKASITERGDFVFFGETGTLEKHGWNGSAKTKLWRYNQHYFDDLTSINAGRRSEWHRPLLDQWISFNPPGDGIGWEPYPTSLRMVNWVKYFLTDETPTEPQLASLMTQADWLTKRLEIHLLGNHLLANAKGLYFAGCYCRGELADSWLSKAREILSRELPEQILADGGHFELSPMYHAIVLEDMLDLINIARAYGYDNDAVAWSELIPRMLLWLRVMSHPDAHFALFNDAAYSVAPSNEELLAYARRLGFNTCSSVAPGPSFRETSGYVRLEVPKAVAICDVARVGPDYLPGHAHADSLSFELSLYGQRLFVNSGTAEYGVSKERLRQRGTKAHNTLVLNGTDSSEVWSGFRVARRAYPYDLNVEITKGLQRVSCSHSGYRRLKGKPIHRRVWDLRNSCIRISDQITGPFKTAQAFYHCHPDVTVEVLDNNSEIQLTLGDGQSVRMHVYGATLNIQHSTWHPEFGARIFNRVICLSLTSKQCHVTLQF